ncbi:MAG: ammonium transporter [Rubripirellula sp.]|nr:ammonium transporter [Rubripirellula sp.]
MSHYYRLLVGSTVLGLVVSLAQPIWSQETTEEVTTEQVVAVEEPATEEPATEETVDEVATAGEEKTPPQEEAATTVTDRAATEEIMPFAEFSVNNLWICISAAMVFIMHLGFTTLEAGLTQKKNAVNIIFKNVWIICTGLLLYAAWGFNAMYPGDFNGYFATGSWFGADLTDTAMTTAQYNVGYTWWGDFIFQSMFAATAATIVSGAVAERVKLPTFMLFSTLLVGFAYPISGSWQWGGGWLNQNGFHDFAGSSIVHGFGGFAALACVIILGPRMGKYTPEGIKPIVGHSMPLAAIGVFLLWFGWFGFNGGSVLSADPKAVSYVFVTTSLAAAAGAVVSIVSSWVLLNKPDVSMALNGILAGLVGITAGADTVGEGSSIIIGGVAGGLVVASILFFDKIKCDDPVGAISVHGVCGVWGTIAVGIFSLNPEHSLLWQTIGTFAIGGFGFAFSAIVFTILKATMGVRVSAEVEAQGLDISEHGAHAYSMD